MRYDRVDRGNPFGLDPRTRGLLPLLLSALLVVSILLISSRGVSAGSVSPAAPALDQRSTGTTLAVVRAAGASLYDESGEPILDLPAGAALRRSGP